MQNEGKVDQLKEMCIFSQCEVRLEKVRDATEGRVTLSETLHWVGLPQPKGYTQRLNGLESCS